MSVRRVLVCLVALAIAVGVLPGTAMAASPTAPSPVAPAQDSTQPTR